ncbi:MFP1 attachment factor 1 [Vigna radiata var. radiata]|uniref:MFP1 attachment factor 1 n=1 Tax=Vigna radiata var. radiata TaxID=3916 RepID=A0A1S3U2D8_VIGRR|nr:MFP1 attachment factor 1 [Vigna radiata var. radiata]
MSEPENAPEPQSEQDSVSPSKLPTQDQPAAAAAKLGPASVTFTIWPPTQRTRDAVINRLIETLSSPSVLSKRYGTMPPEEASAAAHQIENEAFAVAGGSSTSDSDGIEILQVYSKEISKRMLDTVKSKATTGSTAVDNGVAENPTSEVAPTPAAESDPAAAAESET